MSADVVSADVASADVAPASGDDELARQRPVLVTGGGGFLGGALVDALLARGLRVRSFARGAYPGLTAKGVDVLRGDLADADAVSEAAVGCSAVFHVAAKAGIWGRAADFHAANVVGTAHVIAACRSHGIGRLIYTSTPSVVQTSAAIEGGDESLAYADPPLTHYGHTKALAERAVLAANGAGLCTVALRPRLIWGPGDTQLLPRMVARSRAGRLRRVGPVDPLIDAVYIDNAVDAHLLAYDRLAPEATCAGRAYFVTQGEPIGMYQLLDAMLAAVGEPPVTRSVPRWLARAAGTVFEPVWRALGRDDDPPMTRFLAIQLSTANWFDIGAARRDLGFAAQVDTAEGLRRLARWWQVERAAASPAGSAPGPAG